MAKGKKISALELDPDGIQGNESIPIEQQNTNARITLDGVKTYIGALEKEQIGSGLSFNESNNSFGMDLGDGLTLATPIIDSEWEIRDSNGDSYTLKYGQDVNDDVITVHTGCVADYIGSFRYVLGSSNKPPTNVSGDFGTSIPSEGVSSSSMSV